MGAQSLNAYEVRTYATYRFNVLSHPTGLVLNTNTSPPTLYVADSMHHMIRAFSNGAPWTLTGTGAPGYVDGESWSAQFNVPTGLTGTFYIWEDYDPVTGYPIQHPYERLWISDAYNYVVRLLCFGDAPPGDPPCSNDVRTVAGNHSQGYVDGPSGSAMFSTLGGISYSNGTYVADAQNHAIRLWNGSTVSTFAGTGVRGYVNGYRTNAQFSAPTKVVWDSNGNMYVADSDNHVIRKIDAAGNVTTLAGTGQPGYVDGPGAQAQFNMPCGIAFNPADNSLYVADSMNSVIRKVDLNGNVTTYAGSDTGGLVDGTLLTAKFQCPMDILIANGLMYISDTMNNVIRRIDMTTGTVSTYIS